MRRIRIKSIRRIISLLLCICVMGVLCACAEENPKIQADENTFLVDIMVDCEDGAYAIQYEYYLDINGDDIIWFIENVIQ